VAAKAIAWCLSTWHWCSYLPPTCCLFLMARQMDKYSWWSHPCRCSFLPSVPSGKRKSCSHTFRLVTCT
jgi:hypothetical protein